MKTLKYSEEIKTLPDQISEEIGMSQFQFQTNNIHVKPKW